MVTKSMSKIIGIDLGTTNSCVAVMVSLDGNHLLSRRGEIKRFTGFKSDFTQLKFEKTKGKAKLKNDIFSWYEKGNFFEQFEN